LSLSLILCFSDRQFIERVREMAKGRQRKKNKECETKKNSVSRERESESERESVKNVQCFCFNFSFRTTFSLLEKQRTQSKKANQFSVMPFHCFHCFTAKGFLNVINS
jgi:hypothetical protein